MMEADGEDDLASFTKVLVDMGVIDGRAVQQLQTIRSFNTSLQRLSNRDLELRTEMLTAGQTDILGVTQRAGARALDAAGRVIRLAALAAVASLLAAIALTQNVFPALRGSDTLSGWALLEGAPATWTGFAIACSLTGVPVYFCAQAAANRDSTNAGRRAGSAGTQGRAADATFRWAASCLILWSIAAVVVVRRLPSEMSDAPVTVAFVILAATAIVCQLSVVVRAQGVAAYWRADAKWARDKEHCGTGEASWSTRLAAAAGAAARIGDI